MERGKPPLGVRRPVKISSLCPRCKKNKKAIGANRKQRAYCTPCQKQYHIEYYSKTETKAKHKQNYEDNKEIQKKRARESMKRRTDVLRKINFEWKKQPCVDCGIIEPLVIDPDHVRGEKLNNISSMISQTCTVEELTEELAKCDPRCANCHRLKTAKQQGHYKDFLDSPPQA